METDVENAILTISALFLLAAVISAFIAASIANEKHRSYVGFLFLGLFFGPIAIIVALLASPGWVVPAGRRLLVCPRCNSKQNVLLTISETTCWRCDLTIKLKPAATAVGAAVT